MSPLRVAITRFMLASRLWPLTMAQTEPWAPRWAESQQLSPMDSPASSAARWLTWRWLLPWKA
ncbi:hypothetical protein D3C76_1580830 [compost metagenome]